MYNTFLTVWLLPYYTCSMVSFLVYFGVRCKCLVCIVVRWNVYVVVAVLYMWLSYVYVWSSYVYLLY
jgi:hypothetical protein